MTTPRDPDTDTRTRPARSVETFEDRGVRTPTTMGVALLVFLALLALVAIFMVIGLAQG